jgi:hypothetical protein
LIQPDDGTLLPGEIRYLRENNDRLSAILLHKENIIDDLKKRLELYERGSILTKDATAVAEGGPSSQPPTSTPIIDIQ